MDVFFGVFSALCLVYYGILVLYSGIGTSFSGVWIFFSLIFGLFAAAARWHPRIREKVPLRLEVTAVTAVLAVFVVFLSVEAAIGIGALSSGRHSVDYVIVLGTQVRGETMSRSLTRRVERAYEYALSHPNTVLILSGGKGDGEAVSEAEAMYEYLISRGIPEHQLIKEERSVSTYENVAYSRLIIHDREKSRHDTLRRILSEAGYLLPQEQEASIRVAVLTSNFHVFRARAIAKKQGFANVSGIPASSDWVLLPHLCVRECFAILKDKFVGNM